MADNKFHTELKSLKSETLEMARLGRDMLRTAVDALIRQGLGARKDPRKVVADPHARYFGAELGERTLVPWTEARLGQTRFQDWLKQPAH